VNAVAMPSAATMPRPIAELDWLTVGQAALLLQLSVRTLRRLTSPEAGRDRIPSARIGGSIRIRRGVIDKYMEKRTA
jgi:excisionase family DNA binding protein